VKGNCSFSFIRTGSAVLIAPDNAIVRFRPNTDERPAPERPTRPARTQMRQVVTQPPPGPLTDRMAQVLAYKGWRVTGT
jgi:hypothetical protein